MDVRGTINAGISKMARGMKNSVDNCKIDGKIAEKQKMIKTLTREIGNLALVRLEAGDEMCLEIMERYEAIKEAKEAIEMLQSDKKKSTVTCNECGAKTSIEMKFCGVCGTCLHEEDNGFGGLSNE